MIRSRKVPPTIPACDWPMVRLQRSQRKTTGRIDIRSSSWTPGVVCTPFYFQRNGFQRNVRSDVASSLSCSHHLSARRGGPVNVPTLNFAKSAKFRMGHPARNGGTWLGGFLEIYSSTLQGAPFKLRLGGVFVNASCRNDSQLFSAPRCPLGFDLDHSVRAGEIVTKAAPLPILGLLYQSAGNRVAMDVSRPDPSPRKGRLLGMTINLGHYLLKLRLNGNAQLPIAPLLSLRYQSVTMLQ